MSRTIVAVFSGTGNAQRAAGIVSAELQASGHSVEMLDLAAGAAIPELGTGDLLVLCSSTLGFSPPALVFDALKSAPPSGTQGSSGAQVAILCVCGGVMNKGRISGGWSGAASIVSLGVLARKGWEPVGSADAPRRLWALIRRPSSGAAMRKRAPSGRPWPQGSGYSSGVTCLR